MSGTKPFDPNATVHMSEQEALRLRRESTAAPTTIEVFRGGKLIAKGPDLNWFVNHLSKGFVARVLHRAWHEVCLADPHVEPKSLTIGQVIARWKALP